MCNTMKFDLLIIDLAPPELVPVSDDAYSDAELENQRRDSGTAKILKGVRHNRKSKGKVTHPKNRARSRTFCCLSVCDKTSGMAIEAQRTFLVFNTQNGHNFLLHLAKRQTKFQFSLSYIIYWVKTS